MATVGADRNLTLIDFANRLDPDGMIAGIVEIMTQVNPILEDLVYKEGNLPTGHKTTIRSGLPSVTWRKLNYGVQPSKSTTVSVTDTCGMLEAYAETDVDVAKLNGNSASFMLSENAAFMEAMSQEMGRATFYGNSDSDPEQIMGLSPRYNDLSAENAKNIIDAGGTGADNSSIWLIYHGEETFHGIFPKGSQAGLQYENMGVQLVNDSEKGKLKAFVSHYKWDTGMCLRDWRFVVRICNIDISDLTDDASAGADLIKNMIEAIHKIPSAGKGKPIFYVNEAVETFLDLQTLNQANMNIMYGSDEHGRPVMKFRGIPVKKCEALLETEARVV